MAITTRTESVTVADGSFDLHVWLPEGGHGPALLLIQEIFGVGPYIRAVGERLAAAGYVVGAPDVFWRLQPNWASAHDEAGLTASLGLVSRFDGPAGVGDLIAALGHLGGLAEVNGTPGVIGFCLGGTLGWLVAANGEPSVCVSYYGSGVADTIGAVGNVHCPVLFHFGDADPYIPNEQVATIAEAIAGRGDITLNVHHAGHAFDNHESAMFHNPAAAAAAWEQTMAFLQQHLPV